MGNFAPTASAPTPSETSRKYVMQIVHALHRYGETNTIQSSNESKFLKRFKLPPYSTKTGFSEPRPDRGFMNCSFLCAFCLRNSGPQGLYAMRCHSESRLLNPNPSRIAALRWLAPYNEALAFLMLCSRLKGVFEPPLPLLEKGLQKRLLFALPWSMKSLRKSFAREWFM